MVAWWIEREKGRSERHSEQNEKEPQIPSTPFPFLFFFSLFSFPPLSKLSFLSSLQPAACSCGLYEYINTLIMHWTCAHPQATPAKATQHPFRFFVFLSHSNSLLCCFFHNNLLSYIITQFYHTPHIKQRSFFTSAIQFSMTYDSHVK